MASGEAAADAFDIQGAGDVPAVLLQIAHHKKMSSEVRFALQLRDLLVACEKVAMMRATRTDRKTTKLADELQRAVSDLRQKTKKHMAGRETKLTTMMQPTTEGGGGREGAALTNGLRKKRDGDVDSAMIRKADQSIGKTQTRAAADGVEIKESTLQYLKQWRGWRRSF